MLSILVCHSYFLHLDQKQLERAKPYPPLATLQAAEMLRQAGHSVALFDAMLADGIDDYALMLNEIRPQLVLLYEDTFNFLNKMCLGAMRQAACGMVGLAQRSGARVIVGGPDVSDSPAPYLHAGADLALVGEGLAALFDILPRLDARDPAASPRALGVYPGTASLIDGRVVITPGSRALSVTEAKGFAAWDLVDMDSYRAMWSAVHGYFSLNLAASRGCSFRCAWCAKPTWGNQYLQRDVTDVVTEMARLKHAFNPDHLWFADDIFGFRVDWVVEFASALRAADAKIPFTIQTRADLISERMARALYEAGCREAWIGAESGSQRILDAMNKGTTVAQIITARERLRAVGIRVGFFIQLGYLDERLEDILATRRLLEVARPDEIGVSVSYPLPGTQFYDSVKTQLGQKTRWNESSDLDMMFHGTYTSDFYRAMRNLLHEEIKLQTRARPAEGAAGGRHALERRWQELSVREEGSCSPVDRATVAH